MEQQQKMEGIPISFDELFTAIKGTPPVEEYTRWEQLKQRKLVVNEGIDDYSLGDIIMPIFKWNEEDEAKMLKAEERQPIVIYLNSPGGDVLMGLVVAEIIKKSVTPVHITVIGTAASMGSIILMAGHKRYAYTFSNVLIHDGEKGLGGTSNKVKDTMKFFEEKDEQLKQFVLQNTKITEEKYDTMQDREWWMTASKALEYGIIDAIL